MFTEFLIIFRTDLNYPIGTIERRNQRERIRVHSINSTFRILESMLPIRRNPGKIKKPSKADILHDTIKYIEELQNMIDNYNQQTETNQSPDQEQITPNSTKLPPLSNHRNVETQCNSEHLNYLVNAETCTSQHYSSDERLCEHVLENYSGIYSENYSYYGGMAHGNPYDVPHEPNNRSSCCVAELLL